ncbi:hypothetical protein K1T71_006481 [Dendrolimus kikuchii]|uniref:Uncharacterized protein n=1 Tax=Dendrolimus kikuchii TaxID=765133 RepID=A0ACC1D0Z5_9NEOP|nr:hypothetical protein K1T71_006481 [Dendrolimus kikuchii]
MLQEDEIEDIIGDVKLTDSQKSVAMSNVYSPDFTDSSSDRNNSSGKDTYVIEQDDSDTEPFQLRSSKSVINLSVHKDEIIQCDVTKKISKTAATGFYGCSFMSQEIFTQTSKTIFELAEMERNDKTNNGKSLETQTSFISITNKTLEYRIEVSNAVQSASTIDGQKVTYNSDDLQFRANDQILSTSLNDDSSKFLVSGTDDDVSSVSEDKVLTISDRESRENILSEEQNENQYENTSDFSSTNSDIEEDSLMECRNRQAETDADSNTSEIPKSVDNDVEELYNKLSERKKRASNSRNGSPSSGSPSRSPDESLLCDAAARGCEVLCAEVLRRLRSVSWIDVVDTLEELPKVLDKFWGVITEHRIADLIRHVCSHVESPRTQVAKAACNTLSSILKTTNYTKKPDFYEAVAILLTKTGSFSRPVRRAANVALDSIVCGVELSHAVTAICVHGVDHKSPLVRCAASRLLVVSCALAGGGRELLRTRPQSAVCARKHALQALAAFLCDKNTETRKYAERLYSMLRPLNNFEAYYLTDVEVEVATRQMKKYDHLLLCGPPRTNR